MIREAWDRAEEMIACLDCHMRDIVAGRRVEEFTENAAFEAYEKDCPLRQIGSPLNVFAYECGEFRCLLDRDTLEDLTSVALLENAGGKNGSSAASEAGVADNGTVAGAANDGDAAGTAAGGGSNGSVMEVDCGSGCVGDA